MNPIRTIFGLVMAFALTACSGIPNPIPLGPTVTPPATFTLEAPPPPTGTATPEPIPTIAPLTRIQEAEQALFYGDYETARREFESAYQDGSSSQIQAAALWGLGRTEYADERFTNALAWLGQIVTDFPDSAFIPYANFLMGKANYELERYLEAASNYSVYLEMRPGVLDAYVQELRGDAFFDDGSFAEAIEAYNAALAAPQIYDPMLLEIKVAQTRVEIGDYATAISTYNAIFARTDNDYIKAQMEYLVGLAHQELGQTEIANERFLHSVENYPLSYYSYLALVELVGSQVPVSDLDRGLVDYFADQYDVALAAFDRYISDELDTDGTARYYRALSLRELENYTGAIQGLTGFISDYPDHPRWADAWDDKAFIQWFYTGDFQSGAQTYLDFVEAAPTHPEAVDYLMTAARVLEINDRLEQAAQVWQRVADEYPDNIQTSQALFLAGIAQYRRGDYHLALPIFQRSLLLSTEGEDQARAHLWIGKTHEQLGDETAEQASWQQAQSIDPTGYYSERARELLIGRAPFTSPPTYNIDIDLEAERADAAAWLRVTFSLPADTDLTGLGPLAGDPRIVRGTEFWELGLYEQARQEFEDLREFVSVSPENSFRLANYMLDLGLYRSAIFAAREVLTLAGLDDHAASLSAPPYFNHIRYGAYYADLIVPNAEAQGFHPLFLFSVARQESLFEGFVRSTAGAHGLMQIIPSTGASVARSIGWPVGFEPNDLYRPNVSVRLGAQYMATNRKLLDGDLYATLAAYNGGPGNASAWQELAGGDQDLLLEVVRFQETRDYIRFIYEIYNIYRKLYSPVN
ncbi:MAG: tetratricopeptide repeat protein [Anaerolineales bacterium]